MLSTRTRCALALLAVALAISTVSGAPSDVKLRQFLQKSLTVPSGKQELNKFLLAEMLADLAQAENEVLESAELARDEKSEVARLELERAAGPMVNTRERKAGCKNFFWKTFTSC